MGFFFFLSLYGFRKKKCFLGRVFVLKHGVLNDPDHLIDVFVGRKVRERLLLLGVKDPALRVDDERTAQLVAIPDKVAALCRPEHRPYVRKPQHRRVPDPRQPEGLKDPPLGTRIVRKGPGARREVTRVHVTLEPAGLCTYDTQATAGRMDTLRDSQINEPPGVSPAEQSAPPPGHDHEGRARGEYLVGGDGGLARKGVHKEGLQLGERLRHG